MPNAFISVQDLSNAIGVDVSADPGATFAVQAACDICRDIAEQDFTAGTATVALDGSGSDALILAQRPVTSAGSVTVNGIAETDFQFTDGGLLLRGTAGCGVRPVWPRGRQNVQLTYTYGYATVPKSVQAVALQIASRAVLQGVAKSETVGDVSVSYAVNASDLDANERRILGKYRAPRS